MKTHVTVCVFYQLFCVGLTHRVVHGSLVSTVRPSLLVSGVTVTVIRQDVSRCSKKMVPTSQRTLKRAFVQSEN